VKLVADNIQILNPVVQRAIVTRDPRPLQDLVHRCDHAGAEAIDINSGPLGQAAESDMAFLVTAVQSVTPLPLLIDTANPAAIKAGLEAARVVPIINGFSLEPKKLAAILPLVIEWDAEVIGYLLHPDGSVPSTADERLELAVAMYEKFSGSGGNPERLIIDPVVVPATWQNGHRQAGMVLDVIQTLPDLLGFPVKTVVGLSNLTAGQKDIRKRQQAEAVFFPMLAATDVNLVLLNVFHSATLRLARGCRALLGNGIFSWNDL
jgi:5-methyltetrahydrofolate corrinoid/iron sulfur protein methyltransferase